MNAARRRFRVRTVFAVLMGLVALAQPSTGITASALSEQDLKAAFLYNFARFTEWPEAAFDTQGELRVQVIGHDPFNGALDRLLGGKRVHDRRISVVYTAGVTPAETGHVVFVAASERSRLDAILGALEGENVLTVSDIDDFAERGGMIGLVSDKDSLRFVVNRTAASRARLQVSSRLLSLATSVR